MASVSGNSVSMELALPCQFSPEREVHRMITGHCCWHLLSVPLIAVTPTCQCSVFTLVVHAALLIFTLERSAWSQPSAMWILLLPVYVFILGVRTLPILPTSHHPPQAAGCPVQLELCLRSSCFFPLSALPSLSRIIHS